ncbi:hypothetical protein V8C42DRAFT_354531 [Trichoderma barbatum]
MANQAHQETRRLIINLQIQDCEALIKGKHRIDEPTPDREVAAALYKHELQSLATFYSDRDLCHRLSGSRLGNRNPPIASVNQSQPQSRQQDHAAPKQPLPRTSNIVVIPKAAINDGTNKKLSEEDSQISKSNDATQPSKANEDHKQRRCVACMTDTQLTETVQCPCSDGYCHGCMKELFKAAMNDESLFPPRCCGKTIPIELYQSFLPKHLIGVYQAKTLEYSTPNRTYCHLPTCSSFIPPSSIQGDIATCGGCQHRTCTICKGPSHKADCPDDVATKAVLRVAAKNHWQRCYSCRGMVELTTGCYHMTCRCRAQFCYLCGAQWKKCRCELWSEALLTARANNMVDRFAGPVVDAQRGALVARQRENLVRIEACTHRGHWRSRDGAFRCEECSADMPEFIYECSTCGVHRCRRCRDSRR